MATAVSAREAVLGELLRFEGAGQFADRTLDAALKRCGDLDARDRGFFTRLFYGVIERKVTLDAAIDGLSAISPSAIERQVRMILRMGLYQLKYMDRVPDHAAVSETVEMTPRRSRGFVNAILRSFCRNGKVIPLPEREKEPIAYLSVACSVSPELAALFIESFCFEKALAILSAFETTPAITVRVNTLRLTREEFLARVPDAIPAKLAPSGAILPPNADLQALLAVGLCFVQDEASQLAVAALDAHPGMRVLDICAAPGSKSFGAALDLQGEGEVKSFDLHENKISLIRRGAETLGITNLTAAAGDARRADPALLGQFDRVICDVPCSGLGVIGKKPDIRYKSVAETVGLLPVQRDILEAAAHLVKPGGVLVYSTCTLLPRENEEQVGAFLEKHPEFALSPLTVGETAEEGMVTLLPHTHGTDGFFIAKLIKKG